MTYVDKMRRAYVEATEAAHGLVSVRIHVGPAVGDWLQSLTTEIDTSMVAQLFGVNEGRWMGVPLIVEEEWPADQVIVRTDMVIA